MIPVTEEFLEMYRYSHTRIVEVSIFDGDTPTYRSLLVTDGSISADSSQNVRRTISLSAPLSQFDDIEHAGHLLNPYSTRLSVNMGYETGAGGLHIVQVGNFRVDSISRTHEGVLSVSGSGFESYIVDYDYLEPEEKARAAGTCIEEIKKLITNAFPNGTPDLSAMELANLHPDIQRVATVKLDVDVSTKGSRWDLITTYATRLSAHVYCDAQGRFILAPNRSPKGGYSPCSDVWKRNWMINEGVDGVLVSLGTETSRDGTYNGVMAVAQSVDSDVPPISALVRDEDATSPTMWGGKFGKKVFTYENELLMTHDQCLKKATLLLDYYNANERSVNFSAIPNPALEPDDVVIVSMLDGSEETHLITRMSLPLGLGDWPADTMSTRYEAGAVLGVGTYNAAQLINECGTYDRAEQRWATYDAACVAIHCPTANPTMTCNCTRTPPLPVGYPPNTGKPNTSPDSPFVPAPKPPPGDPNTPPAPSPKPPAPTPSPTKYVFPLSGRSIGTPYGARGSVWSCYRVNGLGKHTGADIGAPYGTAIKAAASGKVRHVSYGSPFGYHQFSIVMDNGAAFFYAHTSTRPTNGKTVRAGDVIAKVGHEGVSSGYNHLHIEYHPKYPGTTGWGCALPKDPAPYIGNSDK